MTQEAARKWHKEIELWAKADPGTTVWFYNKISRVWERIDDPAWFENDIYIVDDPWARLKMAQAEGKQLQVIFGATWKDKTLTYKDMELNTPDNWRVKPEVEFPVYRRRTGHKIILRFSGENYGRIVMSSISSEIGEIGKKFKGSKVARYDDPDMEPVETIEIDGITYYDTQPVLASNSSKDTVWALGFFDAKNKCLFKADGSRDGLEADVYTPAECIEPRVVEAWKELKL